MYVVSSSLIGGHSTKKRKPLKSGRMPGQKQNKIAEVCTPGGTIEWAVSCSFRGVYIGLGVTLSGLFCPCTYYYSHRFPAQDCYGHFAYRTFSLCFCESKSVQGDVEVTSEPYYFHSIYKGLTALQSRIALSGSPNYPSAVGVRPVLCYARLLQHMPDMRIALLHFSFYFLFVFLAHGHHTARGLLLFHICGKVVPQRSCNFCTRAVLSVGKSNGCVPKSNGIKASTANVRLSWDDDTPAQLGASIDSPGWGYQPHDISTDCDIHSQGIYTNTPKGLRVHAPSPLHGHSLCATRKEPVMCATVPYLKLTPSRLRDLQTCPRRFQAQYLLPLAGGKRGASSSASSLKGATSPMMQFGSNLHAALDFLHRPQAGSDSAGTGPGASPEAVKPADLTEDDIRNLLSRHWRGDAYPDRDQEVAALSEGTKLLMYYCRSPHAITAEVLATEAFLSTTTTIRGYRVELSARVDRLDLHPDGTLEALDYKVSTRAEVPSARELANDLPTFIYFLLTWHRYRNDSRVRNVVVSQTHLLTLEKVTVKFDQRDLIQNRARLAVLVAEAMNGPMEPRVSAACAWCPVREGCPAWGDLNLDDLEQFDTWRCRGP
jgi:RecB family exonuclease